jgi:hypothetical protein
LGIGELNYNEEKDFISPEVGVYCKERAYRRRGKDDFMTLLTFSLQVLAERNLGGIVKSDPIEIGV